MCACLLVFINAITYFRFSNRLLHLVLKLLFPIQGSDDELPDLEIEKEVTDGSSDKNDLYFDNSPLIQNPMGDAQVAAAFNEYYNGTCT